jgi:predicted ATPase
MMIARIEARRYRCFDNIGIDIPSFAVLVGANGAGKTTLLDIPQLIGDCLRQRDITNAFTQKLDNRHARTANLKEIVFCGSGTDFSFALEADLPAHIRETLSVNASVKDNGLTRYSKIRYELRLEIFNERSIQVKNEYLYLFSEKSTPFREGSGIYGEQPDRSWRVIVSREYGNDMILRSEIKKGPRFKSNKVKVEASMLALPRIMFESKAEFPAAVWFYELLSGQYLFYQPDLTALQAASPPSSADVLLPDAANLPNLALKLQENEKRFMLWQNHVKTALPNINSIAVQEREEDHHVYFRVTFAGDYEITSSGLSEGTLSILALTILPYLENLPAIVFLEEPENGIHPQAIESVLQSLSSSYHSQVLVSSHSPVVLANTDLNQVLCSRLKPDGAVTILSGREHPQLKEWKGRTDLGALFAAGVLD